MRTLLVSLALIPLIACSGGKNDSGSDSGSGDSTTNGGFAIATKSDGTYDVSGSCASNACVYTITTTGSASLEELDMTETGDSYMYHEYHDEFVLNGTNADGTETYELDLAAVTDPADVTTGTTLFYADSVLAGTTWWFGATSADGNSYDCVVTGDSSTYYSDQCPNFE